MTNIITEKGDDKYYIYIYFGRMTTNIILLLIIQIWYLHIFWKDDDKYYIITEKDDDKYYIITDYTNIICLHIFTSTNIFEKKNEKYYIIIDKWEWYIAPTNEKEDDILY